MKLKRRKDLDFCLCGNLKKPLNEGTHKIRSCPIESGVKGLWLWVLVLAHHHRNAATFLDKNNQFGHGLGQKISD